MPKKGRRQIVIDDKIYFYIIKERFIGTNYGGVTIQAPDGRFHSEDASDYVKPSYVESLIREHLV